MKVNDKNTSNLNRTTPTSGLSNAKAKWKKNPKNPFEIHMNKSKFQILGQKTKDDYGLPGVSRSKSFHKREKTLLVQYKNRNKDSKFIDKRIGDKNKNIDPERLAMIRANAETKSLSSKKNLYSLNDEEVLTHEGKALDEFVMKERGALSDEDDEDFGLLDADYVQDQHFGGDTSTNGPNSNPSGKTRADWIDRMIAESKKKKEASKKEKEEHFDAVSKLDANYGGFLSLLKSNAMTQEDKDKCADNSEFKDYDTLVRKLAFSRSKRAEPTSRLRTEEELAREEREKLQTLEKERIRRMKGQNPSPAGALQSADALDLGYDLPKATTEKLPENTPLDMSEIVKRVKAKFSVKDASQDSDEESEDETSGSEDETDDESCEENEESGGEAEENTDESDEEKSYVSCEELDEEQKNEESLSGEHQSDDNAGEQSEEEFHTDEDESKAGELHSDAFESAGEYCSDEENVDGEVARETMKKTEAALVQPLGTKTKKRKNKDKANNVEELPYTFEVPDDYDGFWELIQGRSPSHVATILERMIACNHPKLGPENRSKANAIFAYSLQTLHIICSPDPEEIRDDLHPMNYINSFIPHLYTLTHIDPSDCAAALNQVIDEKYEDYNSKRKKILPYADTFVFLKLSGLLFPASDFQHDVMTRVLVFLCHIMGEAKVYAGRDVVALLFTSALMYEYLKKSCRFVGELLNTLFGILSLAIPLSETDSSLRNTLRFPTFRVFGDASQILVLDKSCKCLKPPKLSFNLINQDCTIENDLKIRIVNDTLRLLINVNTMWKDFASARALFNPASKLIAKIPLTNYPDETNCLARNLQESISNLPKQKSHLIKPEFQVKTLRMLEPKFESIYDDDKKGVGFNAFTEKKELLQKFKKERKGAKRELKKDAQFLARQKLQEVLASDAERKRKVNLIMHGLQTQESEYQKMKKMKTK